MGKVVELVQVSTTSSKAGTVKVKGEMGKVVELMQVSTTSSRAGIVEVEDREGTFKKYNACEVSDVSMKYFREPMPGNRVYHDFVVLHGTISGPNKHFRDVQLYIQAEKTVDARERRGCIKILITQVQPDCNECEALLEVQFNDCGNITLNELKLVLEDHPPRYSLLEQNCWKYATDSFKNVIKKFINHEGTSEAERKRLNTSLAEAEPSFPKRPFYCVGTAAIIALASSISGIGLLYYFQPRTNVAVDRFVSCMIAVNRTLALRAPPVGLFGSPMWAARVFQEMSCASTSFRTISRGTVSFSRFLPFTPVKIFCIKYGLCVAGGAVCLAVIYFVWQCGKVYRDNRGRSGNRV